MLERIFKAEIIRFMLLTDQIAEHLYGFSSTPSVATCQIQFFNVPATAYNDSFQRLLNALIGVKHLSKGYTCYFLLPFVEQKLLAQISVIIFQSHLAESYT